MKPTEYVFAVLMVFVLAGLVFVARQTALQMQETNCTVSHDEMTVLR